MKQKPRLYVPRSYPTTPESRAIADEVEKLTAARLAMLRRHDVERINDRWNMWLFIFAGFMLLLALIVGLAMS